jgi:hypothetical protein
LLTRTTYEQAEDEFVPMSPPVKTCHDHIERRNFALSRKEVQCTGWPCMSIVNSNEVYELLGQRHNMFALGCGTITKRKIWMLKHICVTYMNIR